jgi:hypothetical protein
MPLLDHFHPPLNGEAPWTSIASFWVTGTARWLNRTLLDQGFRAFAHVHLGRIGEADLAQFENDPNTARPTAPEGGVATALLTPPAAVTLEPTYPDEFEVRIQEVKRGMRIVGVIEFVSESNKDRLAERQKFVNKCSSYLRQGIGVVVVDVVTSRRANLHNQMILDLGGGPPVFMPATPTYVSAFRPRPGSEPHPPIDIWPNVAEVGAAIPVVPLPLQNGPNPLIDLEATYLEALAENGL